jgi:hypothetical protein
VPFDAAEVARQIQESRGGVRAADDERARALEMAVRIYRAVGETEWEQRVQDAAARRWVATPLSPLRSLSRYAPCPPEYCVTATDSSFVAPDKHRGALCHLINVGRVMIRYSDPQAAELDSTPNHYPEVPGDMEDTMSSRVLSAKCALRELQELYEWSRLYKPGLAMVDGSLMQLVHVLSKEATVVGLMQQYLDILEGFEGIGVPVLGYISRPASGMVMRAIRLLGCEQPIPHEERPAEPCSCTPLWSIDDGDLFNALLGEGELSPIFQALYRDLVGPNAYIAQNTAFAYLGTEYELARLEFPMWVAERGLLKRSVEIVLHQCDLGGGYPNALTRAHQFAVLHNADREGYYWLLERAGLLRPPTEKARGKRMIGQAI